MGSYLQLPLPSALLVLGARPASPAGGVACFIGCLSIHGPCSPFFPLVSSLPHRPSLGWSQHAAILESLLCCHALCLSPHQLQPGSADGSLFGIHRSPMPCRVRMPGTARWQVGICESLPIFSWSGVILNPVSPKFSLSRSVELACPCTIIGAVPARPLLEVKGGMCQARLGVVGAVRQCAHSLQPHAVAVYSCSTIPVKSGGCSQVASQSGCSSWGWADRSQPQVCWHKVAEAESYLLTCRRHVHEGFYMIEAFLGGRAKQNAMQQQLCPVLQMSHMWNLAVGLLQHYWLDTSRSG